MVQRQHNGNESGSHVAGLAVMLAQNILSIEVIHGLV
jgi:hypothetical protein